MDLTPGQRMIRCLLGEPIDRVPFGVGLGWWPWGSALDRWKRESGNPQLDYPRELGYDASLASPGFHSGIFPEFAAVTLETTADFIVGRNERGIVTRNRRDGESMPEFIEYPVKTDDDWERLKAERLNPTTPGRLTQDWPAFQARLAQTGEGVQVGNFPFGVFGTPRDLLGVEELLVAFYDRPAVIKDMMQHLATLWIALWQEVAEHVQIDVIHVWEDMSGRQGSLISPAMVEEFMMPCYDRIARFARAAGARIISVDTDGDCSQLVPVMMAHGVNMMFPFEVQAGNDIRQFRSRYPTLGIMGGLDKRALALDHAAVDVEVARTADMLGRGRYIPGFDHLIPPDATWDNLAYAARKIKDLCYGSRSLKASA